VTDTTYFEQTALWGKPPQFYQVQVLADILEILPPDVQSVLDVGCGDGYITNSLLDHLKVMRGTSARRPFGGRGVSVIGPSENQPSTSLSLRTRQSRGIVWRLTRMAIWLPCHAAVGGPLETRTKRIWDQSGAAMLMRPFGTSCVMEEFTPPVLPLLPNLVMRKSVRADLIQCRGPCILQRAVW